MTAAALLAAVVLALVHVLSARLRTLHALPRAALLSFGAGISVAYVFVHLLPELAAGQEAIARAMGDVPGRREQHPFVIAAVGLAVFYALERLADRSRARQRAEGSGDRTEREVFWIHIVSFALYNVLVGYLLLHRGERGAGALVLFTVAMGMHFLVNDVGLEAHHGARYERVGRWVVVGAVLVGWAIGAATELPEPALYVPLSFLAGGVVLNVLKEELPDECESRIWAFAAGLFGYGALLLAA